MAKVLVSGVNGFVGKHLAQELKAQGCQVIGVGREPESDLSSLHEYYSCDLTDSEAVAKLPLRGIDAIINLAGLAQVGSSFGQEELYKKVNVGVLKIIGEELIRQKLHPRIIGISTGAVYDPHQPMPLAEDSEIVEDGSPYAMSKILMEKAANELKDKGQECIVVRPFNHIGPGQESGFLVPDLYGKIMDAIKNNQPLRVGNLATSRDYTDVRDVVRAYATLAQTSKPLEFIYNVCSGTSRSGQEILDELTKHIPGAKALQVITDQSLIRPNDPEELVGSNERLKNSTGWQPEIPFSQTIADFIAGKQTT